MKRKFLAKKYIEKCDVIVRELTKNSEYLKIPEGLRSENLIEYH